MSLFFKKLVAVLFVVVFAIIGGVCIVMWPRQVDRMIVIDRAPSLVETKSQGLVDWSISSKSSISNLLDIAATSNSEYANHFDYRVDLSVPKDLSIFKFSTGGAGSLLESNYNSRIITLITPSLYPALKDTWLQAASLDVYVHRDPGVVGLCKNLVTSTSAVSDVTTTTINGYFFAIKNYLHTTWGTEVNYSFRSRAFYTLVGDNCYEFVFSYSENNERQNLKDAVAFENTFGDIIKSITIHRI